MDINLTEKLKQYFGFDKFKGDQERVIRSLMDGNDIFVLMPTEEARASATSSRRSSWMAWQ